MRHTAENTPATTAETFSLVETYRHGKEPFAKKRAAMRLHELCQNAVEAAVARHLNGRHRVDSYVRDEVRSTAWHAFYAVIIPAFTREHAAQMALEAFVNVSVRRELSREAALERLPLSGAGAKTELTVRRMKAEAEKAGYDPTDYDALDAFLYQKCVRREKRVRLLTLAFANVSSDAPLNFRIGNIAGSFGETLVDHETMSPRQALEEKEHRENGSRRLQEAKKHLCVTQLEVLESRYERGESFVEFARNHRITAGSAADRHEGALKTLRKKWAA